jgi:hypothetical protein
MLDKYIPRVNDGSIICDRKSSIMSGLPTNSESIMTKFVLTGAPERTISFKGLTLPPVGKRPIPTPNDA